MRSLLTVPPSMGELRSRRSVGKPGKASSPAVQQRRLAAREGTAHSVLRAKPSARHAGAATELDLPPAEAAAFAAALRFCDWAVIESDVDRHLAVQAFDGFLKAVLRLYPGSDVMNEFLRQTRGMTSPHTTSSGRSRVVLSSKIRRILPSPLRLNACKTSGYTRRPLVEHDVVV